MQERSVTTKRKPTGNVPMQTLIGDAPLRDDGHFRDILDGLPAAIYTTDPSGHITYFNEAAAELWGHRPEIGKSEWCGSWKLFWPDGTVLPHAECPMAMSIKEKRPIRGIEAVAERPDGTRIPFIPYPTPLFDDSGSLIGAVNMLVDITDRKRAEQNAQHLAAIVENSDDAILSKDINGIIKSWNRGAERLFGYTASEAIGRSVLMLIPPDRHDEEAEILDRIRRDELVDHYETIRQRKDGTPVEISITVSPIKDAKGRVVGASKIARDITERRRAQEQQQLLLGEMKHRTKNLAAVVEALARQSRPKNQPAVDEFAAVFTGRLRALLSTGEIIFDSSDRRADLRQLFELALHPFIDPNRASPISMNGPSVTVSEQTAGSLALAAHELATNALKYGALKAAGGSISLTWSVERMNGTARVAIEWKERGADIIAGEPERTGFGSRVIRAAVAPEREGKTELAFEPDGLRCRFEFKSDRA